MDIGTNLSCDDFMSSTSSSSLKNGPCPGREPQSKSSTHSSENKCPSMIPSSTSSSTITSGLFDQDCRTAKQAQPQATNISYELAVAKSIMQQYSTISGDNLFDHLADIIKRIIDERPPNVIDFFEEFSRNVREQKLHLPERFPPDAVYEENRLYKVAKKQLMSMKLPYTDDDTARGVGAPEDLEEEPNKVDSFKLELKQESMIMLRSFYDRVQHLQFFWNQCGFNISSEDIFQLACSMDRLQTHPSIRQCRFWGMINGLKASYYIVEAYLTNEEIESRTLQMEKEIMENQWKSQDHTKLPSHIGPELTPGAVGWENYPVDDLFKMKPDAVPVPEVKAGELFDVPPEIIGRGVNRYSYFVVNHLSDEWIELPICTPKQLKVSRQIKKFLKGDLEADVVTYPCFPGKEKHYLRAMIARITAGSYIAPKDYYRKMTKREKRLFEGVEDEEMEEEEDDEDESAMGEGDEDAGEPDNDVVLLKNEKYQPQPLNTLNDTARWVHVRPNILPQGRIVWFDEEKARHERQKESKRLEKQRLLEEMGMVAEEEEEAEEESESEVEEETEEGPVLEVGPAILTPCSQDVNQDAPVPWVGRFTSNYTNKNERILVMRSNVWPGAYTFVFEQLSESIYLGWGHKYVARNMPWQHMPPVAEEFLHRPIDFIETTDPSVELEEAYRLGLLKKDVKIDDLNEHMSNYESDDDKEDDDDEDEDEEEEEEEEEEE